MRRTVKKIIDGDTFVVNRRIGNTNRIRLAGVRAPEKHQSGGGKAANRLRRLIARKTVTIIPVGQSYGRVVSQVRRRGKIINRG